MHLGDRFGPLPDQVLELFDTIRLRWLAKQLGFEKIVLKSGRLKCFFINNSDSTYIDSEIYNGIIQYISQKNDFDGGLKQTPKHLILFFKNVNSVKEAAQVLETVLENVGGEVEA